MPARFATPRADPACGAVWIIPLVLGAEVADLATYFDVCRRKRNVLDYDLAHVATESEAHDLLAKVRPFHRLAEDWIRHNHPALKAEGE